jgi:hypothetical protein
MNKAWITGTLTREEMEHEHPLELEEIEKSRETEDSGTAELKKVLPEDDESTENYES